MPRLNANTSRMRRLAVLMAFLFTACAEGPITRPDVPVRKWVGPVVNVPGGGQFRTVIFYGPWQCSRQLMNYCREKCAGSGYALQGCMWLADVKMDYQGTVIDTGSRYGMTHCCCNYSTISVSANQSARTQWDNIRDRFREQRNLSTRVRQRVREITVRPPVNWPAVRGR